MFQITIHYCTNNQRHAYHSKPMAIDHVYNYIDRVTNRAKLNNINIKNIAVNEIKYVDGEMRTYNIFNTNQQRVDFLRSIPDTYVPF